MTENTQPQPTLIYRRVEGGYIFPRRKRGEPRDSGFVPVAGGGESLLPASLLPCLQDGRRQRERQRLARHARHVPADQPAEPRRNVSRQRHGLALDVRAPILFLESPVRVHPPEKTVA